MYTKSISLFSTFSRLIRYVTFMPKKVFLSVCRIRSNGELGSTGHTTGTRKRVGCNVFPENGIN